MAPSATETVTKLNTDFSKVKLYPGGVEGIYKEISPVVYHKDLEELGTDEHKAAKVSFFFFYFENPWQNDLQFIVPQLPPYMEQGSDLPSPGGL